MRKGDTEKYKEKQIGRKTNGKKEQRTDRHTQIQTGQSTDHYYVEKIGTDLRQTTEGKKAPSVKG